MRWFRVQLSEDEQRIVNEDRVSHPHPRLRQKMWVLWLLHCGVTREKTAEITGVARSTVQRYVEAFRQGGLEGLRRWKARKPVSELAAYRDVIRSSFEQQPVRSTAEARERIYQLTGIRRGLSQTRKFLTDLGLKWQRIRAIPVPPKKTWRNMSTTKPSFMTAN